MSATTAMSSAIVACDFVGDLPAIMEIPMCSCCGVKKQSKNSKTCSKRCEWFAASRCVQCGRGQRSGVAFCSKACASHSVHANWCPTCAVKQCAAGRQFCSEGCSRAADPSMAAIQRPRSKKVEAAHHTLLRTEADEKERANVAGMFKGVSVAAVITIAPNAARRRAYLNHRAAVECRMSATRTPKYGFGGEGNEHKRFCPVRLECSLRVGADGAVHACANPQCEACGLMTNGFSLQRSGLQSHYCMATAEVAASWAEPNPALGLRAVVVVRAVTGNAQIIESPDEIAEPWARGFDSCVVSDGDATYDGTYLFADDAIEPLYVVLM